MNLYAVDYTATPRVAGQGQDWRVVQHWIVDRPAYVVAGSFAEAERLFTEDRKNVQYEARVEGVRLVQEGVLVARNTKGQEAEVPPPGPCSCAWCRPAREAPYWPMLM